MFAPDQIIFAPTGSCNLSCAHCRVARVPGPLSAVDAVALLKSARPRGIDRVGFSGGEPFLALDFLVEVCRSAVELDFLFDRLMTNAVWWRDEGDLRAALGSLYEAGFDGTFGVSVDTYHGQPLDRLEAFFRAVFDIWGRRDCCRIVWATSPDDNALFARFQYLAGALGGEMVVEDGLPAAIRDVVSDTRPDAGRLGGPDSLVVPFDRIPFSPPAEAAAWTDAAWFVDDFCAGPGNVLYVHPDGRVAVCCGFSNEHDALIVGRLGIDDFDALMANAAENAYVQICYGRGLGVERTALERSGVRFPGVTADQCLFCDYLCKNGLARGIVR